MSETNAKIEQISRQHYSILIVIILLGALLRLINLDSKSLGIDEVLTAIFSLGKSSQIIPKEILFSTADLQDIFKLNIETNCAEIARTVTEESTHPPLFFCATYQWLKWSNFLDLNLVFQLRSLPAILGIVSIALVYYLNRIAFSPLAGLMGAAIISCSPFGVYLSQEARHYTLPIALISIALICLVKIQKNLETGQKNSIFIWLVWLVANSLSFYVHYFCILAYLAQLIILGGLIYRFKIKQNLIYLSFSILPVIFFLPWLPILIQHFTNPKTGWLSAPDRLVPLFQMLINWSLIAIALPFENQSLTLQIIAIVLTTIFIVWLTSKIFRGFKPLWNEKKTHKSTAIIGYFIALILLGYLGIIYILGKDISVAPRYNFIYYPACCALIGASLVSKEKSLFNFRSILTVIVALISSILVTNNLVLAKPYLPNLTAKIFARVSEPVAIVVGYEHSNEIALGISYALALDKVSSNPEATYLAFFDRSTGYNKLWQRLNKLDIPDVNNIWIVASGLKQKQFPLQLQIGNKKNCQLDADNYYRIGVPYQLYRCQKLSQIEQ